MSYNLVPVTQKIESVKFDDIPTSETDVLNDDIPASEPNNKGETQKTNYNQQLTGIYKQPVKSKFKNLQEEIEFYTKDVWESDQIIISNADADDCEYEPIIELDGLPFIYENALCNLQAQTCTFKTTFAKNLIYQSLNPELNDLNLNIKKENIHYCLLDFEMDRKKELPYSIKHIIKNLEYKQRENFSIHSFVRTPVPLRVAILQNIYDLTVQKQKGKYVIIILDTGADLLADVNKLDDSTYLTNELLRFKDENECSIINIIHENPGTSKGRGHYGSEIIRKVNNAWGLGRDKITDQPILKAIKGRWKKLEDKKLFFNNFHLSLMSKEQDTKETEDKTHIYKMNLINAIGTKKIKFKDGINYLVSNLTISDWKAKEIIDYFIKNKVELKENHFLKTEGNTKAKTLFISPD